MPRARRLPVQPSCSDDTGRHVGAGRGRRPSINLRISANSRRGIATSASWNVTYRPCRTTLAPILISFSRSVVRDQCSTASGSLEKYAALLGKTGRHAEATKMEARAKAIRAKHTRENPVK